MYVPIITPLSQRLYRRKGGGGGGKGGGGGGDEGGSSGSSSGRSSGTGSTGSPQSVPLKSSPATGGKTSATAYGNGGFPEQTIPQGQLFAGRTQGGAARPQVYGTRTYGSGYPGISSRGVSGLGFPFLFWPVIWGSTAIYGASYLHDSEYGEPNNSSRPGGVLTQAPFTSASGNTTFHVVSDNTTVTSLIASINANCSSDLSSSANSTTAQAFDPSASDAPMPEQAVQYYRSSTIVLTLEGYNDTTALEANSTSPDTPLPSGIDTTLLDCLNQTIGLAAPLISGADPMWTISGDGISWLGSGWLILCFLKLLV